MSKVAVITIRHWKSLLCLNLILVAATVGSVALSPRIWTARTQFIIPDTTSKLDASLGTLGSLRNGDTSFSSTQVNPLKVQASIMTSNAVLTGVWASDPEKSNYSSIANYSKLFKASPEEQTTNIALAVSGSSPELARERAIALTEAYQKRLNELRRVQGTAREQFSRSKVDQAQQRLSHAQTTLAEFKKSSGLVNIEEQTQGIVSAINTLTTAQAQSVAQAQANEARINTLSTRIGLTPTQAVHSLRLGENKDYQFIRQKLSEVEALLLKARARYTDQEPQVQLLLTQRNELGRQLERYVAQAAANTKGVDALLGSNPDGREALIQQLVVAESESSAQRRQATQLQRQVDKLNTALKSIPVNQARLLELQQHYDVAQGVYKGLIAQVQQANIDAFNSYPNVQILDAPTVDPKPSSPKISLAIVNSILASIIGSIALILLLERLNPLLSQKDLETIDFPIVARIYRLQHSAIELALGNETEVEFQRLGSTVSSHSLKDRRLLITSSNVGEGKTTVTLGLAKALVDLGFRVLVVDGDFRQAKLSQRLGASQEPTSNNLPISIGTRLDLVPTVPKQGRIIELIKRRHFKRSLAAAQSSNNYDYVLVDTAPVSLTNETALMAEAIPNVLFVVRPGISDRNSVNDSLGQLAQHNAQVVGLVTNEVDTKTKASEYEFNIHSTLSNVTSE